MSEKNHFHWKKMFFSGIIFLIPLGVTYWIITLLISRTENYARPFVNYLLESLTHTDITVPEWVITLISLTLVFLFVLLIGWLANFYLGKRLLDLVDKIMLRLPFIRHIYGGSKQIIDAFSIQRSGGSFKKVVFLEYPRRGSWVLGFVTNEALENNRNLFERDLIAVFVPSTPNPTTGFLLYLDPFDMYLVDLEVEEAVKLIVSAGLVMPDRIKRRPVTLGEDLGIQRTDKTPNLTDPES